MKILKFFLLWLVLAIVMLFTWSFGFVAGNVITNTSPPAGGDPILAFYYFMGVCVFNSFLLSVLFWLTRIYSGISKIIGLFSFCFIIQFVLMQMESMFFGDGIGIQNPQVASIIIAGFIVSTATVLVGVAIVGKMSREPKQQFTLVVNEWRPFVVPFLLLSCIVYPLIYLTFGYYIAWQNENLRIFYTKSSELTSFFHQGAGSLADGLYFFQILRAAIWVIATIPLVIMLRHLKGYYLLVGLLTSLLPATQLFIPNPYMPQEIAMIHFVETASSNFIWGAVIAIVVNKYLPVGQRDNMHSVLGKTA
ncbi:MAG TPA: hypothetical protein VK589_30520 [Chryseolinea sp.]|nr:hypothetical protein [Chryseolinea sp.]